MGLFGGSKTYVSSVVYNLAGDEAKRPDFLKTTISGNVLFGSQFSVSNTLQSAYIQGPGIKARSFYRWAQTHYDKIGLPPMELTSTAGISNADMTTHVPAETGVTISVTEIQAGAADVTYWAEQYILKNISTRINEEWSVLWEGTGDATILFPDASQVVFAPGSPVPDGSKRYFYVLYDRTDTASGTVLNQGIWIYEIGSGGDATLDGLLQSEVESGTFFPYIPVRFETKFLSDSYYPDIYAQAKAAYKKATGGDYDELIDKIADNPKIGDIDYTYVVFAVCLNTKDNSARRYLFEIFDNIRRANAGNSITIRSNGNVDLQLNMVMTWGSIAYSTGSGPGRDGAKVSDCWLESSGSTVHIWFQSAVDAWKKLSIDGLVHENIIHKGKSVKITAAEALADADESGFLVPIHYETMKDLSLKNSTQMFSVSQFLVFNCYQVVKTKWYQTGIFKIIVVIAIIAISVLTAGSATAPLTALYASIGTAIGLTGLAAIIAGAVIAQLAMMVISKILTTISVEIFGAKFGAIIAAVATVAVSIAAPQIMAGQSMTSIWASMGSATNLIKLTEAGVNGISGYLQASTQEIIGKTEKVEHDYNVASKGIADLFEKNIGYGRGMIDPMQLTNFLAESESQFTSRTLMTGSDIAEMSMDMITNFTAYTVNTNLNS